MIDMREENFWQYEIFKLIFEGIFVNKNKIIANSW